MRVGSGWGIGGDTSHTGGIEPYTLSGRPDCSGPINIVNKLLNELAPRFGARPGGYTRILKRTYRRVGDAAPTALIELMPALPPVITATFPSSFLVMALSVE